MNNANNSLQHSNAAINVIPKFYNKKVMVYVEGPDDIPFWDELLQKKIDSSIYEIEAANGCEKLHRYITGLKDGSLQNTIVACDKDHTEYLPSNPYDHPNIIVSYGYSIENTMFCPHNIAICIRRLAKTQKDYIQEINRWYSDFCAHATLLLSYDIANYIDNTGLSCFGENCVRFLADNTSYNLDPEKINQYIRENLSPHFDDIRIKEIEDRIKNDKRELRYKIKGHFLTNAILNLIKTLAEKEKGSRVIISIDSLYEACTGCKKACTPLCDDKLFLNRQIDIAFKNYIQKV